MADNMPSFLIFQLYGVMASWGGIAVGEQRPTEDRPTQSAILGLLAAAFGMKRSEGEKHRLLQESLGIGICVYKRGELLNDYHTVSISSNKDKEKHTIVSHREYRSDFFCQIALWQKRLEAYYPLREIKTVLEKPHFNLSLGRKSCPLGLPLNPVIVSGKALLIAFDKAFSDDSCAKEIVGRQSQKNYYWELGTINEKYLGIPDGEMYLKNTRRHQVRNRVPWQFSNLEECHYVGTNHS